MPLDLGPILLLIISIIGALLNTLVSWIVIFGLKLLAPDLILIAIISIVDLIYFINNIIRISLMGLGIIGFEKGILNTLSTSYTWCRYDAFITFVTSQSSIELIAILGLMRYNIICQQKKNPVWIYYIMTIFSILVSLGLAVIAHHYGYYAWSSTSQFCLSTMVSTDENQNSNSLFFTISFALYILRFAVSLIVLFYCYYKVMIKYHQIISNSGIVTLDSYDSLTEGFKPHALGIQDNNAVMPYFESSRRLNLTIYNFKFKKQKTYTTVKLMGAAIAYIICYLPDMILTFFFISNVENVPPQGVILFSNTIFSCSGLVTALFVILSHDPSCRYIMEQLNSITAN